MIYEYAEEVCKGIEGQGIQAHVNLETMMTVNKVKLLVKI